MHFNKKLLLPAFFLLLSGRKMANDNQRSIIFSCIKCRGCVENNLAFIKDHQLDNIYKIVLDTNCYEDQKSLIDKIKINHLANEQIEKQYGHFGNFILIDSAGKKTEFMTDMDLRTFLHLH